MGEDRFPFPTVMIFIGQDTQIGLPRGEMVAWQPRLYIFNFWCVHACVYMLKGEKITHLERKSSQ